LLDAADGSLNLGEVDAAVGARSERIAVGGAAEAIDTLAQNNTALIGAVGAVG